MAQLLVRNIDEDVKARLKARAARNGRSLEAEVREVLRAAVSPAAQPLEPLPRPGLGTRMAAIFAGHGLTEEEAAAMELRGFTLEPPDFGR